MIVIPVSTLKAALLFVPKNEVRYYLNGISIKVVDNVLSIAASDGHTLFFDSFGIECDDMSFIIPRESVEMAIKLNNKDVKDLLITDISIGLVNFVKIDAKYPDFTKVFNAPLLETGKLNFNFDYLARVKKAYCEYTCNKSAIPAMRHTEHGQAVLTHESMKMIVMPMHV